MCFYGISVWILALNLFFDVACQCLSEFTDVQGEESTSESKYLFTSAPDILSLLVGGASYKPMT